MDDGRRPWRWLSLLLTVPAVCGDRHNDCLGDGGDFNRRSSIRAKFQRPDGFASCAVVGASGLLQFERLGDEIDAHEFVLRTNLAPVSGFEAIVGSKTTVRVMNTEALRVALLERACPELRDHGESSWCPPYAIQLNSAQGEREFTTALNTGCPEGKRPNPLLAKRDVPLHDATIQFVSRFTTGNVMTGAWCIALAMHLCPNGIDIYGYTHTENAQQMREAQPQYHCNFADRT
jgi:hypothetical protein